MKSPLLLKVVVGLPLLLLVDYLLMVLLGCASCLFGFGDDYYCSTYCLAGKGLLLVSALLFGWYLYPDVRRMLTGHAAAPKK